MKIAEIKERIKDGDIISVTEHMIFKRNKLVRGTTYVYKCGNDVIRESQYEQVKHLLGRNQSLIPRTRLYKKIDG